MDLSDGPVYVTRWARWAVRWFRSTGRRGLSSMQKDLDGVSNPVQVQALEMRSNDRTSLLVTVALGDARELDPVHLAQRVVVPVVPVGRTILLGARDADGITVAACEARHVRVASSQLPQLALPQPHALWGRKQ